MGARRPVLSTSAVTIAIIFSLFIASADVPASSSPVLERFALPNGLRVWHMQRLESNSVVMVLSMHVGSRSETADNNGISHFLEHMNFAQTNAYPEGEVTDVITRRGGVFNGQTLYEKTIYYAMLAARDFPTEAKWISQVVFHPTLPADRVDRERNVVFQEKGGRAAWYERGFDKHGYGDDVVSRLRTILFPKSSLAMPIIGMDAPLEHIDHDALKTYYQNHYAPNNAVLLIVGNVSSEDVHKACQDYFADLKPENLGDRPAPSPPATPPQKVVKVRAPATGRQCDLMMGARSVTLNDPNWWSMEVLTTYLQLVVEKKARLQRGLAYGVEVANTEYSDTGTFSVSTSCERRHLKTLQAIIDGELDALRKGNIDADKLTEAKNLLLGRRALALESNMNNASWLEELSFFYKDDEPLPDYDTKVGQVDAEDLTRVANKYLAPEQVATVVHIPLF